MQELDQESIIEYHVTLTQTFWELGNCHVTITTPTVRELDHVVLSFIKYNVTLTFWKLGNVM
jgi:hypothetical protein